MKILCAVLVCLSSVCALAPAAFADDDRRGVPGQSRDRFVQQDTPERRGENRRWNPEPSRQGSEEMERKRQGRMSPDERRALRRQIDEVGNELYRPRR